MNKESLALLRGVYHSLKGQLSIIEDSCKRNPYVIEPHLVDHIEQDLQQIYTISPLPIPQFTKRQYAELGKDGEVYYRLQGVRSYLVMVIGKLEVAIDTVETSPITERREFNYVKDAGIRGILVRDYQELQRAFIAQCWKAVIIMSGGAIEALLMDRLLQNQDTATSSGKAPKKQDIWQWDLSELINVSLELKIVSSSVEKLSQSVREYRNLIHAGNEIRKKLTFGQEEARIALEVLHIIDREFSG